MGLYEDLIALGWQPDQIAMYYPGLEPGATTYDTGTMAADRSYAESMAAFERGLELSMYGRPVTEYDRQMYLAEHPEYFGDVARAQLEIGIPSDASLAASYPQYATGTRYQEYGTTAPALLEPAPATPAPPITQPAPSYQSPGVSEWGDMMAAGILGALSFVGLGFLFGKK